MGIEGKANIEVGRNDNDTPCSPYTTLLWYARNPMAMFQCNIAWLDCRFLLKKMLLALTIPMYSVD